MAWTSSMMRAAPRICAAGLFGLSVWWTATGHLWGSGLVSVTVLGFVVPSAPKRWWRYVRHGRPAPPPLDRGGRVRLYVEDPGRSGIRVIAEVRALTGLPLDRVRDLVERRTGPVFDDLTERGAADLKVLLEAAGATVRVHDAG